MVLIDINKIWFTDEAVHIETKDGKTGTEYFADYPSLKILLKSNGKVISPPLWAYTGRNWTKI